MSAAERRRANPLELALVAGDPLMVEAVERIDVALADIAHRVPQGRFVVLLAILLGNVIHSNPQLDPEESIAEIGGLVRTYLEVTKLSAAQTAERAN